jgi:putative membrane protein
MQLSVPDYLFTDLVSTLAFGIVAIFLVVFGYWVFDRLTPRLDFSDLLNKGNNAMALVIASFILGLCYVIGRVVAAVLGG